MKKFTIGSTIGDIIDDVIKFVKRNWCKLFFVVIALYWTYVLVAVAGRYMDYTGAIFLLLNKFVTYMLYHHSTVL